MPSKKAVNTLTMAGALGLVTVVGYAAATVINSGGFSSDSSDVALTGDGAVAEDAELVDPEHLAELEENGVDVDAKDIVATAEMADGEIAFLEEGDEQGGLAHIIEERGADFLDQGVNEDDIILMIIISLVDGQEVDLDDAVGEDDLDAHGDDAAIEDDLDAHGDDAAIEDDLDAVDEDVAVEDDVDGVDGDDAAVEQDDADVDEQELDHKVLELEHEGEVHHMEVVLDSDGSVVTAGPMV